MKKIIYIAAFTVLGIFVQFLIHAYIEIWYIRLLLTDFPKYGLGLSWDAWFMIHGVSTAILFLTGSIAGFWQGVYWWGKIYLRNSPQEK